MGATLLLVIWCGRVGDNWAHTQAIKTVDEAMSMPAELIPIRTN